MGNGNAKNDMERYRNRYPGQEDDPKANQNYEFYANEIPSRPRGDYVEEIHKKWFYDYDLLEEHHGYIQWLFPIREHGMNWDSQMLQLHEIEKIKANPDCIRRFLRSYDLMLNFYGCKVIDTATGKLGRTADYASRYRNLETHSHNFLRITRILKCLGELGFEHYKKPFLEHFVEEIWVNKQMRSPADSCRRYWAETLRDDAEREALLKRIEELSPTPQPQNRQWGQDGKWSASSAYARDSDSDSDETPNIGQKPSEEVERERARYRAMIAEQSKKDADDHMNVADSSDDDDDDDDDNDEETAKIRKLIEAQIDGDSDDSDEMSEEEGDKPSATQ